MLQDDRGRARASALIVPDDPGVGPGSEALDVEPVAPVEEAGVDVELLDDLLATLDASLVHCNHRRYRNMGRRSIETTTHA